MIIFPTHSWGLSCPVHTHTHTLLRPHCSLYPWRWGVGDEAAPHPGCLCRNPKVTHQSGHPCLSPGGLPGEAWGCGAGRVLTRPPLSSMPCPQPHELPHGAPWQWPGPGPSRPSPPAGPWQRAWDRASWGVYPPVARRSWLPRTLPSSSPTPFNA